MLKGILPISTVSTMVVLGTVLSSLPATAATFVPLNLSFNSPPQVPLGQLIPNPTNTGIYYYDAAKTTRAGTFSLTYQTVSLPGNWGNNLPSGNSSGDLGAGIKCSPTSCISPRRDRFQTLRLNFTPDPGFTLPQVRLKAPSLSTPATIVSDARDIWDATSTVPNNNSWTYTNPTPPGGGPILDVDRIINDTNYISWTYTAGNYPARNGLWTVTSTLGMSELQLTYLYDVIANVANSNSIGVEVSTLKITEIPEPSALLGLGLLGLGGLLSKVRSPRNQLSRKQSN